MIPKIIHYCWFGGKEKPESTQKFIAGWKERLPDYEFMEWSEQNFDIASSIPYVQEAYEAKKFAFVSDYVRMHALCAYGGVYFDTDVEILKDFSAFLEEPELLLCYECKHRLCTAFMATAPHHPLMESFKEAYHDRTFIREDGSLDTTTINEALTDHMTANGFLMEERNHKEEGGVAIYTSDYFSAQDLDHGHPYITENTYAVHRFEGSWRRSSNWFVRFKLKLKYDIIRGGLQRLLGYERADRILDRLRK